MLDNANGEAVKAGKARPDQTRLTFESEMEQQAGDSENNNSCYYENVLNRIISSVEAQPFVRSNKRTGFHFSAKKRA